MIYIIIIVFVIARGSRLRGSEDSTYVSILFSSHSIQKNQEKVNMIKSSKNFSKAFNILLQERNIRECERNVAADDETNGRAKKLRQYLADVIEHEKDATEERIERYTKQQTALLKAFCEKVKQEFSGILCAVDDVPDGRKHFADGTNYDETIIVTETGANNSKLLLSSHLTPPVTPDSTPMSIGNSPNFRQQTSFFTAGGARISTLAKNVSISFRVYQVSNSSHISEFKF